MAEDSLVVSEDDFSVKVTSDVDPMFWVRIKRTDDQTIVVTDFKAGSLQQITLNIALRKAVSTLHKRAPKQLTFKNVAPLTHLNDNERADFARELNVLRVASESIANVNKGPVLIKLLTA